MILTGPEIRRQVELGNIEIDPYVPEHVNPASVDLTLGDEFVTYDRPQQWVDPLWSIVTGIRVQREELDSRRENRTQRGNVPGEGIVLRPGQLYLMHTVERVRATRFVPIIDGKSSLGRLGVSIHQTAGYGDIEFDGQYTLEVTCVLPVRLYAGMRIAQMRFHAVQGEIQKYEGNYVDEASRGPVASKSWKQFR